MFLRKCRKGKNQCIKVKNFAYKMKNKSTFCFMTNIFKIKENRILVREKCKRNLETLKLNQLAIGAKKCTDRKLRFSGNIKAFKSLSKNWKGNLIKYWKGKSCNCLVWRK